MFTAVQQSDISIDKAAQIDIQKDRWMDELFMINKDRSLGRKTNGWMDGYN